MDIRMSLKEPTDEPEGTLRRGGWDIRKSGQELVDNLYVSHGRGEGICGLYDIQHAVLKHTGFEEDKQPWTF